MIFLFYLSIFVFSFQRHGSAKLLTGSVKVDIVPISTQNFGQVWSPSFSYGAQSSNVFNDIASYIRVQGTIKNTEPSAQNDANQESIEDKTNSNALQYTKDYISTLLKSVLNAIQAKDIQPENLECGVETPLYLKNLFASAILKADRNNMLISTNLRTLNKKLGLCFDYTRRKIASINVQSTTQWNTNCRTLLDLTHHFDQGCTAVNTFHSHYISSYLDGIWMNINARVITYLSKIHPNFEANKNCKAWNLTQEVALNSNAILALGLFVKQYQATFSPCIDIKNRLLVLEVSKQFRNGMSMMVSAESTKKIRLLWKEPSPSGGIWLIDVQKQLSTAADSWKLNVSRVFEL